LDAWLNLLKKEQNKYDDKEREEEEALFANIKINNTKQKITIF